MNLTDDLRANHYVQMRSDSGVAYRDTIIPTERERQAADVIDALVAAVYDRANLDAAERFAAVRSEGRKANGSTSGSER